MSNLSSRDVVRVAAWQCCPASDDPDRNATRLTETARRARAAGARLLVAPELTLTGYDTAPLSSTQVTGAADTVADAARTAGIAVVAGVARLDQDEQLRNSSIAADRSGRILAIHDKAHPFGELDRQFVPGAAPMTMVEIEGLHVGLLICYEVEFPEPARLAALAGADLLAVPTANMAPYLGVHDLLVPARALENAIPVVYANRVGTERSTTYLGRSLLVDGNGIVQAEGSSDIEELLVADLGPGDSTQLRDRRPHLFDPLSGEETPEEEPA